MSALVSAEFFKARTTRTAFGLALALLAIVALFVSVQSVTAKRFELEPRHVRDAAATLGFVSLFALVYGMLSTTGEHRHGTITHALLITPVRERLVVAKAIAAALLALVLWVAATLLALVLVELILAARGVEHPFTGTGRVLVGTAVGAVLWAALGVGIGAIVKNQVGAIIGAFAWLFVVESIFAGLLPGVRRFMPGGLLDGLIGAGGGSHRLGGWSAGLLTLAYVVAACGAGAVVLARRDVS